MGNAQAQAELITKNFLFNDGVYLNLAALQQNKPSHEWSNVTASLVTNPQTFITKVEFIEQKANAQKLDLQQVWAVVIDGIPYVQFDNTLMDSSLASFAGLRVRGKICLFSHESKSIKTITMNAYNPMTGTPFRTQEIERDEVFVQHKIMNFETGEVVTFNKDNFLKWIEDDSQLTKTVQAMSAVEVREKLFKCLLIYVDRKEVFVKD